MIPLKTIEGVPDRKDIVPGMAFFPGTGPDRTTCGDCKFRGLMRESRIGRHDDKTNSTVYKSYHTASCAMFTKLTGKYGPKLDKWQPSCKYFEKKQK